MAWGPYTLGSLLRPEVQREALARFVHRHTRNHRTHYVKDYPLQFDSDADWLAHTVFKTNRDGTLHATRRYCRSSPTWPDNPELRPNSDGLVAKVRHQGKTLEIYGDYHG